MPNFIRKPAACTLGTGPSEPVTITLPSEMARAVQEWMTTTNVGLSKSEALRRLIDRGLRA